MLSVVIPTLNAAVTLECCIGRVAGADEIIVVDGGSSDETREIAVGMGACVLRSAQGRGAQLGAGADAARGNWLLFLHSDTMLEPGWRESIDFHIACEPAKAACFRFRLDAHERRARLIETGVAMRFRLLGLPYGDQGLLISRQLYDLIGGYRALPLMEDVDIVRRIGRGRIVQLRMDAVTSAERWRRDGWSRRTMRNLLCLLLYGLRVPLARIARIYT